MAIGSCLSGYYDVSDQLPHLLRRRAEAYFEEEEREKSGATPEQFEARRKRVREHFLRAIGGIDLPRTPLNEKVIRSVARDGYRIDMIVFESRPDFHVTANLYLPDGARGPRPAVLFVCGHGEHAKTHTTYQRACIDLVRQGMIVLAMDCVGQGERMQYYSAEADRQAIRYGTVEHTVSGLQFSLTGGNIAQVFLWDMIRALDLLETLPEVDKTRIGVTGASGGGTQSSYLMIADPRLCAAAPLNYLTSREEYMKSGQAHDSEQNLYGAIADGPNNDDYCLAFAPKPLLIGEVDSDFFCIEGGERTFARAKYAYSLLGKAQNVEMAVARGTHNLNDELRQAVVNFFREVLLGLPRDFVTERGFAVEAPETLWCTKRGQVVCAYENERTVTDLNRERIPAPAEPTVQSVRNALGVPEAQIPLKVRHIEGDAAFFFTEPEVAVAGQYLRGPASGRLAVLLLPHGTADADQYASYIQKYRKRGDVFLFDPRGIGSVRCRDINAMGGYEQVYGTMYKLNCDAVMMKGSILGMQIFDVLRALEYARTMGYGDVLLAGCAWGGLLALLAGYLDESVRVEIENLPPSFAEIAEARFYEYHPLYEVFGLLNAFDTPQLIERMKERVKIYRVENAGWRAR